MHGNADTDAHMLGGLLTSGVVDDDISACARNDSPGFSASRQGEYSRAICRSIDGILRVVAVMVGCSRREHWGVRVGLDKCLRLGGSSMGEGRITRT